LSWLITADPTNPPLWQPVRKDGKALRIDAGGYQSRQIAVTYTSADVGTSPTASQVTKLMLAKLNARKPVNILFAGDSITEGDDSTAIDKQAPNQPGYAALATAYLAKLYPGQVTMNNVSAPGEGSAYFTKHLAAFSNPNTNVLVIGLGMNDPPGGVTTEQFRANIMALIMAQRAANPACEIILVASWPSNPDWIVSNNSQLGEYRAVEYSIANTLSDVFVADFSTTSLQILQKKTYADITGSGAAHPNDFMYVVFAQILLKTMLGI
jgi:lysophospholipase L1-like esterase